MKSKLFTMILALFALAASSFAEHYNNMDINQRVLSSFTSRFSTASDVTWSRTESYMKASFKLDGNFLFAYYMPNGELIGVARNISSNQLPLNLQSSIRKDFSDSWITELFEFSTQEETIYMATIENGDEKTTIKSSDGTSWGTTSKVKKP